MSCPRCDGRGHICPDDVCRWTGDCRHEDSTCPLCFGDEDYELTYDADDEADDRYERSREDVDLG
jgi:hypothetical protein